MSHSVLSPEQLRVAADLLARGGYRDTDDVVTTALRDLAARDAARAALLASVRDAQAEGSRDGFATPDAVEVEMRRVIENAARTGA